MEKIYYVYAFDIKNQMIVSALSCHNEKTVKQAYLYSKNEVNDTDANDNVNDFVFNFAKLRIHNTALGTMNLGGVPDFARIEYPTGWYARENRHWMEYKDCSIDDFEIAEAITKANIEKIRRMDDRSRRKYFFSSSVSIQFMYHAYAIISKTNALTISPSAI